MKKKKKEKEKRKKRKKEYQRMVTAMVRIVPGLSAAPPVGSVAGKRYVGLIKARYRGRICISASVVSEWIMGRRKFPGGIPIVSELR